MNRLARQVTVTAGGEILGERYLPLGSTDVSRIVEEIAVLRPDFVLNQLIGPSQYEFIAAMADLRRSDPYFASPRCPVLSCNLTECELPVMGTSADGIVAAGPWFQGMPALLAGQEQKQDFSSSFEAAAFASVIMLAELLNRRPGAEDLALSQLLALPNARQLGISARTHHTRLPIAIARVENGGFNVLDVLEPIEGDPYLTAGRDLPRPVLRVVT